MVKRIIQISKIIFKKYYVLLLLSVVLISYGQMVFMYVWQDDNALFFKLAHISEKAGYLGPGPFGDGAYKYIHTSYIPIYYLFGFNTIAYFSYSILIYFLAAICIFKVFSEIFSKDIGKLAGLLFGAGYIASDGFIRIFNSIITSISIILISLLFLAYWKYFKLRDIKWYFFSLLLFFLATELAVGRTHYLISIVVLFELIFLSFEKIPKSLFLSLIRLIPFVYIFYSYYILSADHRSGNMKTLFIGLSKGELYQLYSLITSFTSIVVPDWIIQPIVSSSFNISSASWLISVLAMLMISLIFKKLPLKKIFIPLFVSLVLIWQLFFESLFSAPILSLQPQQLFTTYLGGLVIIFLLVGFVALAKYRKIYLFLCLWTLLNIAAYSAYNPTVRYESINRYLAHSFIAWIGVLGVIFLATKKHQRLNKLILAIIIFWGVGNLISAVIYQNNILQERSNPTRNFYHQLKTYVPQVKKGDIFYFDVSEDAIYTFEDAFSVASMPETTAIAWRYGLDRYDIKRFTLFDKFINEIKQKNKSADSIHSFFYSEKGLEDTTYYTKQFLSSDMAKSQIISQVAQTASVKLTEPNGSINAKKEDLIIDFDKPLKSVYPLEFTFEIEASPVNPEKKFFPLRLENLSELNSIHKDESLKKLAFNYINSKKAILDESSFTVSSQWQDRKKEHLFDQDLDTVWQPNRIDWRNKKQYLMIDLTKNLDINRFVWINGFGNNTPVNYSIDLSIDGVNWQTVRVVNEQKRVDDKKFQIIHFVPTTARYVKFSLKDSLSHDSPLIAEVWVVPTTFTKLDLAMAEDFVKKPFKFVSSTKDLEDTLSNLNYQGEAQIYWQSNKDDSFNKVWKTKSNSKINITYDGKVKFYKFTLFPGGTNLTKLKLSNFQIPGEVKVYSVAARSLKITDL